MKTLFWLSIWIILYSYIGYPVLVYLVSLFYRPPIIKKYVYPTVSIIMSVYNEEKNIENKLLNLMNLDYPSERIEIIIGSDGSNDKTGEILSKYQAERIKIHLGKRREGKPSTLNTLVKMATGEILVFTDARQRLHKDAIKELVKNFSDPKVGSVSGELHFEGESNQAGRGVGLYWRYEKFIRKSESKMGSMLGATGALYAIRRELFPVLPKDLILDDVYVPMQTVQKGYRAIFDKKAKIYDRFSKGAKDEFLRKTRTLAGNFQLFTYMKWLFNPFKSFIAWQFISHKFLRLMVPFLLVAILISDFFLWNNGIIYKVSLILQFMFYSLVLVGAFAKNKNRIVDVAYMFCVMNAAAVVGLFRFVANKQGVLWEKTNI